MLLSGKMKYSLPMPHFQIKAGFHTNECNDSAEASHDVACVVGSNVDSPSAFPSTNNPLTNQITDNTIVTIAQRQYLHSNSMISINMKTKT